MWKATWPHIIPLLNTLTKMLKRKLFRQWFALPSFNGVKKNNLTRQWCHQYSLIKVVSVIFYSCSYHVFPTSYKVASTRFTCQKLLGGTRMFFQDKLLEKWIDSYPFLKYQPLFCHLVFYFHEKTSFDSYKDARNSFDK